MNIRNEIDIIASNYYKTTSALFITITFFNRSISVAFNEKNEKMLEAYKNLEKNLLENNVYEVENPVMTHMPSLCFSFLVSAFENFLIEISSLTLTTYPQKIAKESVDFKKVIELSKEEIISFKANEYINQIMYKSPKDYLKSLCDLLSLDQKEISPLFINYIEIKARRDLGVHNNWKKNEIYDRKISEAGISPCEKQNLAPDGDYFSEAFNTCSDLVETITNQVCENLFKVPILFTNNSK